MKNKIYRNIISGFLLLTILIWFSACENFMVDAASFKDQLKQEVLVAGAEEIEITIQAATGTGTTSPNGPTTVKLGVEFNVTLQEDQDYGFIRWATYYSPDTTTEVTGLVSFTNPTAASTKAKLLSKNPNILIRPVCEERPYVEYMEPGTLFTEVVRNYPITLQFNKNIDPASVSFDSIDILGKLIGSGNPFETIEANFADPVVNDNVISITVDTAITAGWVIDVTLKESITDTSGLAMNQDFNFKYSVNTVTDTNVPTIDAINAGAGVSIGSLSVFGSSVDTHRTGDSTKKLYLSIEASDDIGVQNIAITERHISDQNGGSVDYTYPEDLFAYSSSAYFEYEMQCQEDGLIELSIKVQDVNGNPSSVASYQIIRDTTSPDLTSNASNVVISGGGGGYYSNSVNFTATSLTDIGIDAPIRTRSNLIEWAFSFDGGTNFSDWDDYIGGSTVPIPVVITDLIVPIHVKFRDDQGNETAAASLGTIQKDGSKPEIGDHYIVNEEFFSTKRYVPSQTVEVKFKGTDGGSGVGEYFLSDASSTPDEGDIWFSVGSVDGSGYYMGSFTTSNTDSVPVYLWLKDLAGNISDREDVGTIFVDSELPYDIIVTPATPSVGTIHTSGSTYFTQDSSITFTLSATDDDTEIIGFSTDGTSTVAFTTTILINSPLTKTINAIDLLKNVSSQSKELIVKQDIAEPTCTFLVDGTSNYKIDSTGTYNYYREGELKFTASDIGGSGVKQYVLSEKFLTAEVTEDWTSYTADFDAAADGYNTVIPLPVVTGNKPLYLHIEDNVGKVKVQDIGNGKDWKRDMINPSIVPAISAASFNYDSGSNYYFKDTSGSVDVTFTSSTDADSGLAGYSTDSSRVTAAPTLDPIPFGAGTDTVYAYDKVGNRSAASIEFTIINDTSVAPPTVKTSSLSGWYYELKDTIPTYFIKSTTGNVNVEFESTEPDSPSSSQSGLDGFSINNTAVQDASTLSLTIDHAAYTIYAFDKATNISSALNIVLINDSVGPAFIDTQVTGGYFNSSTKKYYTTGSGSITATIDASDSGSGFSGLSFADDDLIYPTVNELSLTVQTDDQTLYAYDNVGNTTMLVIDEVIKDISNPVITEDSFVGTETNISGFNTSDPAGGAGIDFSDLTSFTSTAGTFNGSQITGLLPLVLGQSQVITITAIDRVGNESLSFTLQRTYSTILFVGDVYTITGP